jgi:acyl-CoA synthetase (AMP-forming)/AMP-acid ligase II
VGNFLKDHGVKRGDRVCVYHENSTEAVISIFGILKADAIFVMINPTTKRDKLFYILNNCQCSALVCQAQPGDFFEDLIKNVPSLTLIVTTAVNEHDFRNQVQVTTFSCIEQNYRHDRINPKNIDIDLATIIYTSGSTGFPKGVMSTHLNMLSAATSISTYLENVPEDIIINVLPLSFDYGLYQLIMTVLFGGTLVLEKSFSYPFQFIKCLIDEKVTGFPGLPTIFAILLQMEKLKSMEWKYLRYITNTGAALPLSQIRDLSQAFKGVKIYSMYGLTECKRVTYLPPYDLDRKPGSVGRGMPNEEVYIIDDNGAEVGPFIVGELVVRGSNVMRGYWENPQETEKVYKPGKYPGEIVLHTGDLFYKDEEGYLYFVSRKDEIIKSRGEKVSPKEVENVLYNLEGVVEAAVVGVPDPILGDAIKAVVKPRMGSKLDDKSIKSWCRKHLEDFMVPTIIEIVSELPRTGSGKIDRKELKHSSHGGKQV